MKRFTLHYLFVIALVATTATALLEGCKAPELATGGAYAQTNAAPDLAFYTADSAFDLAYSAVDAAFKFERDNRALLWKASPEIKHTLDKIRPQAWDAAQRYARARTAYLANPIPANLDTLNFILAETQNIAAAATAALPKGN